MIEDVFFSERRLKTDRRFFERTSLTLLSWCGTPGARQLEDSHNTEKEENERSNEERVGRSLCSATTISEQRSSAAFEVY